ncbi:7TM diverse intracellular signaling domain-containing protein [Oligoflexus tunisiensis]|uniref:7TM diverse intracellular signaling domain-containing protein n=1 Tax=Oligoflexus tunisiensis TaxID=708132 RepID=UPI001C407600|nr:7TM diverse intracellular signaling domain-containing protein [Oligoflexus tunisiensis]
MTTKTRHESIYYALLIALFSFAFTTPVRANLITITDSFETAEVGGPDVEYFEDRDGSLSLGDVTQVIAWKKVQEQIPNFGYSRSAFWFRFSVRNEASVPFQGLIEVQYPILDFVDFHVLDGNRLIKQSKSGDMIPFTIREVFYRNPVFPVLLSSEEEVTVYVRVQTESSVQTPFIVWNEKSFWTENQLPFAMQSLYFGVMLAMVVYNFFIFLSHKSVSYLLYVGFVLCYALFQISLQGFGLQFLWPESPDINRLSLPLTISTALFFASTFAINFLKMKECSVWLYRFLLGFALFMALLTLASFFLASSLSVRIGVACSIPVASLCILSGLKSWRSGNPLGLYFMLAWISFLVGTFLAALNKFAILDRNLITESTQQIGSYLEVTLLSFALAYRMNLMSKEKYLAQRQVLEAQGALYKAQKEANDQLTSKNQEIQEINRNLETIVAYRTRELKAIFDNIPQGIASLNEHGVISQNHSRHLKVVLNKSDLTGQSIIDILASTKLSMDKIDRVKESLKACVGENELNFEINAGNFPRELSMERANGTSYYSLTWSPELTDDGMVHSILMTIEDVTDKKKLEEESEKQRTNFQVVQELLQCDADKFERFAGPSGKLLQDNRRLAEQDTVSMDDIRVMFANAHTIKGGARTLNLSILANTLHETEGQYAQLLNGQLEIDKRTLLVGINRALAVFDSYIAINTGKLGRKSNMNQVMVDVHSMREHYQVLHQLAQSSGARDVAETLQGMRDRLGRMIFRTDREVLEQCLEPLGNVAKDLGKPCPMVVLSTCEVLLPQDAENVLRHIMVHIIRNALDHGIEGPEERMDKGKRPAGTLEVCTRVEDQTMILEIKDDGRGLAIRKLREKGLNKGVISEDAGLDEIAELIFAPEISTASALSQISGRGMGMDAVRKFLTEAGGSIRVKFLGDRADYMTFALVMELPLFGAQVSGQEPEGLQRAV